MTAIDRSFGRQAFGLNPAAYHAARPDYPEWVYDRLVDCGLKPGARVFEIGAGTGKATRRLIEAGADPLVAIEPDARLADFLEQNQQKWEPVLRPVLRKNKEIEHVGEPKFAVRALEASLRHPALTVVRAPFEEADLAEGGFDLGVSATAFHWLDEAAALEKVARLLRPGGWWAAIWHVFGDAGRPDPFHEATQSLLSGYASPSAGERGVPFGLDVEARTQALTRTGAFDVVDYKIVPWQLVLTAEETVALYATYSDMAARPNMDAVLMELGRIAREEFGDRVERNMTTSLFVARRGQ